MAITLDDEELWQMVAASHTGIMTTLRRDGWPVSLPTWFAVLDQRVYVRTRGAAAKARRLRHDPRSSFLVERGEAWRELAAVLLLGHAHEVADEGVRERVRDALNDKYASFRTEPTAMPKSARQHYGTSEAIIEFVPDERIISWDNSKLRRG